VAPIFIEFEQLRDGDTEAAAEEDDDAERGVDLSPRSIAAT
jgi:hypothetical protein